jgi:hypothetical protein
MSEGGYAVIPNPATLTCAEKLYTQAAGLS